MPEIRVKMAAEAEEVTRFLEQFAERWECSIGSYEGGQLVLPPYMLRKHGILFMPESYGWSGSREDDATTWEDYLLVRAVHELADLHGGEIYYGGRETPVPPEPDRFVTFDDYVEFVLENVPGILKETKKMWMYSHQKRSVR